MFRSIAHRLRWLAVAGAAIGIAFLLVQFVVVFPSATTNLRHPSLSKKGIGATGDDLAELEGGGDLDDAIAGVRDASRSPGWISYRLLRGKPYLHLFNGFKCKVVPAKRDPLPPDLLRPGVFDFLPEIATNLKLAVMGDSVGMQIAQTLDEMAGTTQENRIIAESGQHDALAVSFPVRGGGVLATFRYNLLLDQKDELHRRNRRLKLSWNRTRMKEVLDRPMLPLRSFDVMIQRITFPWTKLSQISYESLKNNTDLVSDVFQAKTLILVNMHFCNNIINASMYRELTEKREVVRNFSRGYIPNADASIQRILVLDFDILTDLVNEVNAQSIGFDTRNTPVEEWMINHYMPPWSDGHSHHIAHTCAEMVPDNSSSCIGNMISLDGMHICPSTFGGRITAGLACLIGCATEDEKRWPLTRYSEELLRKCERRCNERFMSLKPIPTSEMVPWNESMSALHSEREHNPKPPREP
jgi:hypothetical protein